MQKREKKSIHVMKENDVSFSKVFHDYIRRISDNLTERTKPRNQIGIKN